MGHGTSVIGCEIPKPGRIAASAGVDMQVFRQVLTVLNEMILESKTHQHRLGLVPCCDKLGKWAHLKRKPVIKACGPGALTRMQPSHFS